MRVLLVHPRFPLTYWGFEHGLRIIGKKASLPPLGLITLAACLPADWELRLVDLNVQSLAHADLAWADAVFTGGMLVQAESAREVVRRARAAGRYVAVGGPGPTTSPELFEEADLVFQGEVEERVEALVEAVERRARTTIPPADDYPDVTRSPLPRYDLLDVSAYASMSLQYSRGCPYRCEFCDIIEIFGRKPRVKTSAQVVAELEALHRLGFRGSVFLVDDNFIGNRPAVKKMLPAVTDFQETHGRPFDLYTEASVNLASDADLVSAMVDAGFNAVFLGIETPSPEALRATLKFQNAKLDLTEAVTTLTRAGLEVMAGFIVGFDTDGPGAFDAQRRFILPSPIPFAMVGVLTALPSTALWRRLDREGRLRTASDGDHFARPNFVPRMDEQELLRGYLELVRDVYSPDNYYARCARHLDLVGERPRGTEGATEIDAALRAIGHIGIASPRRGHFWRLVAKASRRGMPALRFAIAHAVQGEHLIRYTEEHVVPRLSSALRHVRAHPAPSRHAPRRMSLPVLDA